MAFRRAQTLPPSVPDGGVLGLAKHAPAFAVGNPAKLGQEDSRIALIELDALRISTGPFLAWWLNF